MSFSIYETVVNIVEIISIAADVAVILGFIAGMHLYKRFLQCEDCIYSSSVDSRKSESSDQNKTKIEDIY